MARLRPIVRFLFRKHHVTNRDEGEPRPYLFFIPMKRSFPIQFFLTLATVIFAVLVASPALAQAGDTPQILLSVLEASPGATIEIAGGHFEPDVNIAFILIQNESRTPIGTAVADWEGNFAASFLLPHTLQPGKYEFHAVDERNRSVVTPFTIVPDPNREGDVDLREQVDNLLAPVPTFKPGVVPGEPAQSKTPVSSLPQKSPSTNLLLWVGLTLSALGSIAFFKLTKSRRA